MDLKIYISLTWSKDMNLKGFWKYDKSFIEIGYLKEAMTVYNGNLSTVNTYDSYFINSQIINDKKTKFNLYINQTIKKD